MDIMWWVTKVKNFYLGGLFCYFELDDEEDVSSILSREQGL